MRLETGAESYGKTEDSRNSSVSLTWGREGRELPFPEVHNDGEERHDSPVEDVPIQAALSNGSNDGILLGLRDVHLPAEWEPVTGRKPLLSPTIFKIPPLQKAEAFPGAARSRASD